MCTALAAIQRSLAWMRAGEWVPDTSTRRSQLCDGSYQCIGDRHNRGFGDRRLDPRAPRRSPLGDDRAITQFSDGHGGEKDLMSLESTDRLVERRLPPTIERGAEHAGINDESHESAAMNASYSSSVRPSINNASTEASTGAAASCSGVRSRGNKLVPWGASCWSCAASLTLAMVTRQVTSFASD